MLSNGTEIEQFIIENYKQNLFVKVCNIQLDQVKCGDAVLSMEVDDTYTNLYGAAHGGALATLMDTAMGVVSASVGKRVVTLNLNINYINAIYFCDKATAYATVMHKGISTLVIDVVVKNTKNELVTSGTGTLFIVGSFDEIPESW
ncbi:MAG: PaaI family thioesterase [Selenomonadaceae bacterium]